MQFNLNWLSEYISIGSPIEEICDQLTMAGLEVDNYEKIYNKKNQEDYLIKLDLTPNRGDCFSIRGVARELSILNNLKFQEPKIKKISSSVLPNRKINIIKEAPSYIGRHIENFDNTKPTTDLVRERLEFSGVRLVDPIVDITNYILLETGQPLHAFDQDKLDGDIFVRFAKTNERIILLEGGEVQLKNDCLVIADEKGPIAMAGIMGGLETAVDSSTKSVFLESAFFVPGFIRGRARRYGIQTDASTRFERGVDFNLQNYAIQRASNLIQNNLGGDFGPLQSEIKKNNLPKLKNISFDIKQTNQFLGTQISKSKAKKYFIGLGCELKGKDKFNIIPPSWRYDLEISQDLVEEIARLEGYDKIQEKPLPQVPANLKGENNINDITRYLVNKGYAEVITYSFIDPKKACILENNSNPITLNNPISENMSLMRPSLLTSLLESFTYNKNRGKETIRIFESGSVFNKGPKGKIVQNDVLGILIGGHPRHSLWNHKSSGIDFFELKGEIENIYQIISREVKFKGNNKVGLHPGKTSSIYLSSKPSKEIGYLGSINPQIMDSLGVKDEIIFAQLNCNYLLNSKTHVFKRFSKFPATQRDLSFVVDKEVSGEDLINVIKKESNKYDTNIIIFDVYEGQGIPPDCKSISFAITWRSNKGTLNEGEINKIVDSIISAGRKRNWELRDK